MRYLIKFSKESNIKFVSHLDLMRTIQRIIRRSALPIEYSKGFNPHMTISLAQPLSVGMYSNGEYMDVVFNEELHEWYIKDKLNENCPPAIRILDVIKIPNRKEGEKKIPQSMASLNAAKYLIKIKYNNTDKLNEDIKKLGSMKEWNIVKKTKSGEKEVNIKKMVKEFKYKVDSNELILNVVVSCGSAENLSAELLAKFIQINTTNSNIDAFVDIKREELYALYNKKPMPLYEYYKKYQKQL